MISAIILFKIERDKINEVAETLTSKKGITEVFSVSGKYDLVALARVSENEALAQLVTDKIRNIDGIIKTETMIAFKTFSKFDLESMFDLGS